MSDALTFAIEELREQLAESVEAIKQDPKMTKVLKYHAALNTMEELVGIALTPLASAFGLDSGTATVQPGEFYGIGPLQAAKLYLKKRGKPASTEEIVTAIRSGGAIVPSVDKLRVSLSRSTLEIAKVGSDHYGLLEFYPEELQRRKKGKGVAIDTAESELLSPNGDDDLTALKLDENDIRDFVDETDKHVATEAAKQTAA